MSDKSNIVKNIMMKSLMAAAVIGSLALSGCKPSEKHYKSAYTAALEKRERDEARRRELQADLGVDKTALQDVEDSDAKMITISDPASDAQLSVKSKSANFHREDNVRGVVASVATMKMASNARSLAADLVADGFKNARMVRSGEEYIVIIEEGADAASLAHTIKKFRDKNPGFPYMGQGEIEIIIAR
ncbi:MAG: hypothetical protein K2H35_03325 [Muribaculaceae bacterium]|nr:hypothetical protein [Muribaculaceae bacterium]